MKTATSRYAKQLLEGMTYLHGFGIVHRDIKGANVLVDTQGCVKLMDFGCGKHMQAMEERDTVKGTPFWMAPEIIRRQPYGTSADIWSFGCTVLEMVTGRPPWSEYDAGVSILFKIGSSKEPPPFPETCSDVLRDFLLLCFNRNAKARPSAAQLLLHPFIIFEGSPVPGFVPWAGGGVDEFSADVAMLDSDEEEEGPDQQYAS